MRAVAVAAALGAALCHGADAVSVDVENGVYKLEENSFDTVVGKFPYVLVKFHAPWCGHCKAMKPDFEKAARKLKKMDEGGEPSARLAKVDATKETNLAVKYGATGFPTLLVFKDGELFDTYRGGRDKDDIVNYMSTMSQPAPLGMFLRAYYIMKSPYKAAIRAAPFIPPHLRKYFFAAFPLLCAYPFLMGAFLIVCCRGGSSKGTRKGRTAGKAGKRDARSSSPGGSKSPSAKGGSKEGEAKGSDEGQDDADADPKDEQEKKED